MTDYQAFPVSNYRTGFNQSLEPWLLPRDGYQSMVNAHLYRGVLERIEGYTLFAVFTNRIIESLGVPDGLASTFTITLSHVPTSTNFLAYGTIVVGSSAETFTYASDASATVINLIGSAGGTGTINLSTKVCSITFNTPPPANTYSCAFIAYDYAPASVNPIMGIKPYYLSNGGQDVLVFDTKRVGKVIGAQGVIAQTNGCINVVSELPHDYYAATIFTGNGGTATYTITLAGHPFLPGTLKWTEYLSTGALGTIVVTDNGVGGLIGTGVTSGSVNYVTGAATISFSVNVPLGNYYTSTTGVYGNLFTGKSFELFLFGQLSV